MILSAADVRVFGALRDVRLEFTPGLNLVVGENEAGKSTLFSAIGHTLLTPTKQTKTGLEKALGRFFPRPDGTVLECTLEVDVEGRVTIARRWGSDPRTVVVTPEGAELSGPDAEARTEALLPVRPGTFAAVFLVDQARLDATLARIGGDHQTRDEIAALLRRARSETGGVSVEAFDRALGKRLETMFDHWDRERNRPADGRGIEHPWVKKVGELLAAWYALQRARAELDRIERAERELEEATGELEEHGERLRACERFLALHKDAYRSLAEHERLVREIRTQSDLLADLRAVVRRWPVVDEELRTQDAVIAEATARAEDAQQRLAGASEARRRVARRETWVRAEEAQAELEAARARLAGLPSVDPESLAALREAERDLAAVDARLSVGELRARVVGVSGGHVGVTTDGEDPREIDLDADAGELIRAHRRIRVGDERWSVEVETGEESFAELQVQRDAVERRRSDLAAAMAVASTEEAAERVAERENARRDVAYAERRIAEVIGDRSLEGLREEFVETIEEAGTPGLPGVPGGDEQRLALDAAAERERLGAAVSTKKALESELAGFVARYESQESVEDRLAEVKHRVSQLEEERASAAAVPDGFASTERFVSAYRDHEERLEALRADYHDARIRQAELLARLPERTTEEVGTVVDEADREFSHARRRAEALDRVSEAMRATVAEQQTDPFEPLARSVSRYLAIASEESYAVTGSDDPLVPGRFARSGGPDLAFALLSQGTRDMVALAIRLALAETAVSAAPAPLLLDDPLVDMDPRRRAAAARAITEYARTRQVVLFTCHPDHADLFGDAPRLELTPAGRAR